MVKQRWGDAWRRALDVAVAGAGLVIGAPVLAVVAVALRLTQGSPVLFRQRRSGRHGEEFTIVKFRTMRAERFPGEPDPDRLTKVGSLLRHTSLDELPQLWNVLKGDMGLIGPRPTLPEQVALYGPHERRRLEVRPGITGWAQVNGRNSLSWPERIELDIWYVDHRSAAVDARIVALTIRNLFKQEGITAEGGVNPGFPGPASTPAEQE